MTTVWTFPVSGVPPPYHAIANSAVETDIQLIVQVQQHSRDALEVLYDRYAATGMGLANRILHDRSLAEDVTIEAFWWVWRFAFQFRSAEGSFADWFLGFVRHFADEELGRRETRLSFESAERLQTL